MAISIFGSLWPPNASLKYILNSVGYNHNVIYRLEKSTMVTNVVVRHEDIRFLAGDTNYIVFYGCYSVCNMQMRSDEKMKVVLTLCFLGILDYLESIGPPFWETIF